MIGATNGLANAMVQGYMGDRYVFAHCRGKWGYRRLHVGKVLENGRLVSYKEPWLTLLVGTATLKSVSLLFNIITMRLSLAIAAVSAPSVLSFPWMKPEGLGALMNHPEAREAIERRLTEYRIGGESKVAPRQANSGAINGVVTLLNGTLSAVADNLLGLIPTNDAVKGLRKFPESKIQIQSYSPDI
jgi:hypothetical protein